MATPGDEQSRLTRLKQLADRKLLERIIVATGAILLTNILKYLLSLKRVGDWFFDLFGVSPSAYFYANLRYFVIAILIIAYAFALYFLYKRYITSMPSRRKTVFAILTVLIVGALFALNVYALPRRPDSRLLIPTKEWSNRIAQSHATNGGIFAKAGDDSFPTQVWTTAQALTAIIADQNDLDDKKIPVVRNAFGYIEKARHPNTQPDDYDEGWGLFAGSKKSTTEIAGWVTVAHVASLESEKKIWNADEAAAIRERIKRDLDLISQRQSNDGGWRPIKEDGRNFTRTYSTVIALWALIDARRSEFVRAASGKGYDTRIKDGIAWLLKYYVTNRQEDGTEQNIGWVPNPNRGGQREAFDGLTAQVLFVLSRIEGQPDFEYLKQDQDLLKYKRAFLAKQDLAKRFVCSNDRIHDFDLSFTRDQGAVDFVLEGSTLLWFPWSYAALTALSKDGSLQPQERAQAGALRKEILDSKIDDINHFVDEEFMYVLAENLYCFSVSP